MFRELSESCRSPSNRGNSAFLGFSQEQNRTKKQVKRLKEHRASGNLSKCPIDGWLQGPEKVSAPLHILFPDFCLGSPFLLSPIFPLFLESLKMCKCWSTLRQWDLVLIRPSFCNYKKYVHWRMLPEPIIESLCRVYFPKKLTWKLRKPVKSDWKLIKRFLWEEKETESIYKLPVQSNPVGSSRSTRCQKSHYKVPYKRTRQLGDAETSHFNSRFQIDFHLGQASFLSRGAWNGHLRLFRKLYSCRKNQTQQNHQWFFTKKSRIIVSPQKNPPYFFLASPVFCSKSFMFSEYPRHAPLDGVDTMGRWPKSPVFGVREDGLNI